MMDEDEDEYEIPVVTYENYLRDKFVPRLFPETFGNLEERRKKFSLLKNWVIRTKALVAGGSVTGAYTDFISNDIDIYIHLKDAIRFDLAMENLGLRSGDGNIAPPYDQSFFRKNNILARYPFYNYNNISEDILTYHIDVMVVKDDIPLENVVTNFDLTFCEVWWDGRKVKATDSLGLFQKKGFLRKEYVSSLQVYLNEFIIKRIKKYMKRGFQITYESMGDNIKFRLPKKEIESYEEWMVKKVMKVVLNKYFKPIHRNGNTNTLRNFGVLGIENYTIDSLKKSLEEIPEDNLITPFPHFIERFILIQIYKIIIHIRNPSKYIDEISRIFDISIREIRDEMDGIRQTYNEEHSDREPLDDEDYEEDYNEENIPEEVAIITPPSSVVIEDFNLRINMETYNDAEHLKDIFNNVISYLPNFIFGKLEINESTLPQTCFDFIMYGDEDISEYISNEDNIILFNAGIPDEIDAICSSKGYLQEILKNPYDNFFYECNTDRVGDGVTRGPVVKIPIDRSGLNGYIYLLEILALLRDDNKIYYILPKKDDDGNDSMFNRTVSFRNYYSDNPNFVSANHCQDGTNILIYTLKVCEGNRCSLSSPGIVPFNTPTYSSRPSYV